MMIYRLEFATSFVRIVADDGETQREIAHCNGSGNRWLQAVKDAKLIVASLNAYTEENHEPDPA